MSIKQNNNFKNKKKYILLFFISLLCINNINKTNGLSILKLVKYNKETIEETTEETTNKNNYNRNNINNHINININFNKINTTVNDKNINNKLNEKNNENDKNIQPIKILNYNKIKNIEIEKIDTKEITEILEKNYTIFGNIIKQSIIYDNKINNFVGEVIINYNNSYHNHHYCKINISISKKINATYINKYIYKFYNFDRQIKLICNYNDCLELFDYNNNINIKQDEYYKCNILDNTKIKDEL